MIDLIDVEEPLRNALKIIGQYCKRNDCKTCELKINDDTCITDKDPDVWWMYLTVDRKTEPLNGYQTFNGTSVYVSRFEDEPQIDIVRCVECKYKHQCNKAVTYTTHEPTSVTISYKPIDFCSYGEREERRTGE